MSGFYLFKHRISYSKEQSPELPLEGEITLRDLLQINSGYSECNITIPLPLPQWNNDLQDLRMHNLKTAPQDVLI